MRSCGTDIRAKIGDTGRENRSRYLLQEGFQIIGTMFGGESGSERSKLLEEKS